MKRKDEVRDLRGLDRVELTKRLESTEAELMNLRFRQSSGQLQQSAQLRELRKRIARIKTAQRAQETQA